MTLMKLMLLILAMISAAVSAQETQGQHDQHEENGHQRQAGHEPTITISEVQIYNLGIKVGPLNTEKKYPY